MATQLLARRGLYSASAARVSSSRRSRPCKLVVKAYLNNDEGKTETQQEASKSKVTFQLPHHVEYGQDMCLIGEDPALGSWDVGKCVPMAWHEGDVWTAEAQLTAGNRIEYKYIVRDGDETKTVYEWQPTMNMDVQPDNDEVTVRDCWQGGAHEILPGTVPIPSPEVAAEEIAICEAAPAEGRETEFESPTPAATAIDAPPPTEAAAAAADIPEEVAPAATAVEDLAAAPAAAAGEGFEPDADSVVTTEEIAAGRTVAAAAVVVNGNGAKPRGGKRESRRSRSTSSTPSAATAKWDHLATSELKELCKQRGLAAKGQRNQLLNRLQQQQQQQA